MRSLVWLWLLQAALIAAKANAVAPGAAPEYSIKAGYILLFTRYVAWPDAAFATARDPIVICVLGQDPFGTVLDQTLAGQQSQRRPLSVRRITDVDGAQGCHVAYVGGPVTQQTSQWFQALARRPVLTISEHLDALAQGAMLCFVSEMQEGKARIRFDASLPSMQQAGLSASSQMLVAARKVHREDPGVSEQRP